MSRGVLLSLALLALAPQAVSAQEATLSGTWRHTNTAAEQQRRHQAIDRATDDMNVFMQGAARGRLREATDPAPELTITDDGAQVVLSARGRRITLTTDGTARRVSGENGSGTLAARRRNGRLVVTGRGDNGTRTTFYQLSEDGRRLVLEVRMTSDRLSAPLRYRATCVRR